MGRNSHDGSYIRFIEMETLAKVYFLRAKYFKKDAEILTKCTNKNARKIQKINKACDALGDPYKTIIQNTFFDKKNLYWWEGFYSKTTYYRLRNKAIKAFLAVYEIQ